MRVTVVAGNPKPQSRTVDAARRLATGLTGAEPDLIDVVDFAPRLLDWGDEEVRARVEQVAATDLAIVASPTFKGTYAGLLKLFLDQFDTGTGLRGVVAVPLMLGADWRHALAPELTLKPVLVELGATCPAPSVYQIDRDYAEDPARERWLATWGPVVRTLALGAGRSL